MKKILFLKNKKYLDNIEIIFFLFSIIFFVLFTALNFSLGVSILGIALLFYFPGNLLIKLIPALEFSNGIFGKFSLSILYSFCISSILGLYCQFLWGFNTVNQVWAIVILNLAIFLAYIVLHKTKMWQKLAPQKTGRTAYKITHLDYLPILILFVAFAGWIIISPLAQNADNFLGILRQSVGQNINLLANRRIFISFLWLTSNFLRIEDVIVYRYVPVALFFTTSLALYDYIRRNFQKNIISIIVYLALLAPAVILAEVNNIRPQVVLLALLVPILLLQIDSLKNKNIYASVAAMFISAVAALFHELGFIVLAISSITVLIHLGRIVAVEKKISWKHILIFLVIIYPYLRMVDPSSILHPILVIKDYSLEILSRGQIRWHWWFLDNYIDADGVRVSFTGKNTILYYLYNGILPLALLIYSFVLLKIKGLKVRAHYIPPILYFAFFFLAAEIFPRATLNYLPSRAWVHIMIATVLLLALNLETLNRSKINLHVFSRMLLAIMVIGYCGSVYIAKTNIKEVYAEELPSAKFINNELPKNALILSSQYNIGLVSVYGGQTNYDQIFVKSQVDKKSIEEIISNKALELSRDKVIPIRPKIVQTLESYEADTLVEKKVTLLQEERNNIIKAIYSEGRPIYFLYSYRKLDALNAANQDRQSSADGLNKDTYKQLGFQVVYSDNAVIILKVR